MSKKLAIVLLILSFAINPALAEVSYDSPIARQGYYEQRVIISRPTFSSIMNGVDITNELMYADNYVISVYYNTNEMGTIGVPFLNFPNCSEGNTTSECGIWIYFTYTGGIRWYARLNTTTYLDSAEDNMDSGTIYLVSYSGSEREVTPLVNPYNPKTNFGNLKILDSFDLYRFSLYLNGLSLNTTSYCAPIGCHSIEDDGFQSIQFDIPSENKFHILFGLDCKSAACANSRKWFNFSLDYLFPYYKTIQLEINATDIIDSDSDGEVIDEVLVYDSQSRLASFEVVSIAENRALVNLTPSPSFTSPNTYFYVRWNAEVAEEVACIPDWKCYNWGSCSSGIQQRTCYDSQNCGTLNGQPQTIRLCVTPTLTISATVGSSFEKTDKINIVGNITDEYGSLRYADLNVILSSGSFRRTYQLTNRSIFSFNYTTLQSDPIGTWTIEINATDGTNVGFYEKDVSIFEASTFETYNVVFKSPDEGTPYNRGESANIIVRVRQGENNIEDADVFIYISNERINLTETTTGTYFTTYKIPCDAPLETLPISVRAEKNNTSGTSTVNIYVLPATLNAVLTASTTVAVGTETAIIANVTYPDGIPASGLDLNVTVPNGTLALVETSPGVYTATYTPTSLAVWNLQLDVEDAYANTITRSMNITITQPGILDLVLQYWYFIVAAVVIVGVIAYPLSKRRSKESKYNKLIAEGRRIMKMQEELQEAYFKLNEIDMDTFKKKSADYEKRLTEIREEAEKLKPGEVE